MYKYDFIFMFCRKLLLYDEPLEEFRRNVEEINDLLSTMIGPSGRCIAINNSGCITITKSGIEIITLFKHKGCPERDFVIGCTENLIRDFGDGSKTFIVLLEALLFHSKYYSKDYLIKHFSKFLCIYNSIPKIENSNIDYCKIIETFFSTRFPLNVSCVLSNLLKDWIEKNKSCDSNVFKNILNHFDALVTVKMSSPLNESKVIKGLSITGHFHGKFPNHDKNLKLIIIYFPEENESSEDNIQSVVVEIALVLEKHDSSNLFIITNCTLSPSSLQMLNKYSILTNVSTESVHLLHEYAMNNNYNKFENPPEVKVFNVCNSFRTDFIIEVPFCHLTLCAPSKIFCDSYIKSLKSCLKLCCEMLINKSLLVDCCKYEKLLRLYLIRIYKETTNVFTEELMKLEYSDYSNLGIEELCLCDKNLNNLEAEFEGIMECLKPKLQNLDNDIILIVIRMLNSYISKNVSNGIVGTEPLNLKIEILNRVFNTFLNILKIDQVIKIEKM